MNLKNILIIAGVVFFTSSCSKDFLDTKPITKKTDATYYTTPQEIAEALTGCYDGLQLNYNGGTALPVASMVLSDLCFGGTGATDNDDYRMLDEFDINVAPSYMNMYQGGWQNMYKTIYRCNMVLSRMGQVDWGNTPELATELEAEARFIRAYTYFDLVRMFERVPLLTEPSTGNIPQSEPDETYKLITEDLLFAIKNGNTLKYNQIASTNYGHANKWAAASLMARVYLYYTGYYGKSDLLGLVSKTDALEYVEDVITNSSYGLVDNYYDLWPASANYQAVKNGGTLADNTYAGETNKEIVFAIKYTYTSSYDPENTDGNHWMIMNGLRVTTWAPNGYAQGWGCSTVLSDVYNNWDANDDRREASIMAIEEEGIEFNEAGVKEYTGYYTKKYTPTCDENGTPNASLVGGEDFMIGNYQDYFAIRYADVLLMAAELGSSNALDYVNQVRNRSNAELLTSVDKDVIFEERRLELAFEGIRYWDILRYDHTLAYAAQKVSFNGIVKTGGVDAQKIIDGSNLVNCRGLFQIPNDEITLSNGVLKQNPGW
ncbi:MAG: RagB/SusD family nutrient uptake outer membrane protein [Salinivirgaceae bacterium]|jgi:hypothetical protein|nr:RagB/SusD family nutrient uptake outer membrane protein [Salinivirgaceae bacterium]